MDYDIKKPDPIEQYEYSFTVSEENRAYTARREARAKELGIKLYVLEDEESEHDELEKLEDFIRENFLDLDLDVPEAIKEKYLNLKKQKEEKNK